MAETLIRTAERVSEFGEVFTPTHIVQAMHNQLSERDWATEDMIYLEPTCGHGNFLVDAISKKIEAGLSPLRAANTTFGLDILKDNISDARTRIFRSTYPHIKYKSYRNKLSLACIIINNIIKVKDSREFIKSGEWERYTFYDYDPTGGRQVKSLEEREKVRLLAASFLKKHGR